MGIYSKIGTCFHGDQLNLPRVPMVRQTHRKISQEFAAGNDYSLKLIFESIRKRLHTKFEQFNKNIQRKKIDKNLIFNII